MTTTRDLEITNNNMKEGIVSIFAVVALFGSFFAGVHCGHSQGYGKGRHDGIEAVYLKLRDRAIQQSEHARHLPPEA
jgi:hypothetical protein